MKILKLTLVSSVLTVLVLLFAGCKDETLHTQGTPEIYGFASDTLVRGDELTIYGTGFGLRSDSSFVMAGSVALQSTMCRTWSDAVIRVTLPDSVASDSIFVVVGTDTTKKRFLLIIPLPPIAMAEIPAGNFLMGNEYGLPDEMPVHSVTLSNAFFAGVYEITQGIWWRVMRTKPVLPYDESLPVANVTWAEAVRFCNAISKVYGYDTCYAMNGTKFEFIDTAKGYRLPTEAEWEYSTRAGSTWDFAGNGNLADLGWYGGNSGNILKRGGQKAPNAFGLYDVHGNVREYCWDWYSDTYYTYSPAVDPKGPSMGARRVTRGGAYTEWMFASRITARVPEDTSVSVCGIRLFRNK